MDALGIAGLPEHSTYSRLKASLLQLNPTKDDVDALLGAGAAGRAWYFSLNGSGQGQSFHERSHQGGDTLKPLTFAVRPEARGESGGGGVATCTGKGPCTDHPRAVDGDSKRTGGGDGEMNARGSECGRARPIEHRDARRAGRGVPQLQGLAKVRMSTGRLAAVE